MNTKETFYLFSNAGKDSYPSNTLTSFTNRFPVPLEVEKNYEIGIEGIGFSSAFKNILLPKDGVPSLIVTNCNNLIKYYQRKGFAQKPVNTEGPISWSFDEDTTRSCTLRTGGTEECNQQECFYFYVTLKDINYTDYHLTTLCQHISRHTRLNVEYTNKKISFSIGSKWIEVYGYHRCYVMMHDTFIKSFGFDLVHINSYKAESTSQNISGLIEVMNVGYLSNTVYVRETFYKNHRYRVMYLDNTPAEIDHALSIKHGTPGLVKSFGLNISLMSNMIHLERPAFPKTIKIVCENIEPQIFNSDYSKNMLVYTPDFEKLKNFTTQEIESVDYMPLMNTILTEMKIKLLDEQNEQIQLLPGPATWIKMSMKKRPSLKKSFNTVLTSGVSTNYEKNVQSSFKVKLPNPLYLDETWGVCVSSLSHPTAFSTFLAPEDENEITLLKKERSLNFVKLSENLTPISTETLSLKDNYAYEKDELVGEINTFLSGKRLGSCDTLRDTVRITPIVFGKLQLGLTLARILGDSISTVCEYDMKPGQSHSFNGKINLNYMAPKYIMVYASIVRPILVGGEYRKLIRISPIEKTELAYSTNYFRHKEFVKIENTLIDNVHIILASHDGKKICFGTPQDVIVNLEFSNHLDE